MPYSERDELVEKIKAEIAYGASASKLFSLQKDLAWPKPHRSYILSLFNFDLRLDRHAHGSPVTQPVREGPAIVRLG
jgi:hypothetical protein